MSVADENGFWYFLIGALIIVIIIGILICCKLCWKKIKRIVCCCFRSEVLESLQTNLINPVMNAASRSASIASAAAGASAAAVVNTATAAKDIVIDIVVDDSPKLIETSNESMVRTVRIKKTAISKVVPMIFDQEMKQVDCINDEERKEQKDELQNEIDQDIDEFMKSCLLRERYVCVKKGRTIGQAAIRFCKDNRGDDNYILVKCIATESQEVWKNDHLDDNDDDNDDQKHIEPKKKKLKDKPDKNNNNDKDQA